MPGIKGALRAEPDKPGYVVAQRDGVWLVLKRTARDKESKVSQHATEADAELAARVKAGVEC